MRANAEELRDVQMSRYSWDYENLSKSDHWFLMADSYMDICHFLLSEMVQKNIDSSFHHAKVAVSLFEHAVELFLKAALCNAGQTPAGNHKLDQLHDKYNVLYPEKEFSFQGNISDFVKKSSAAPHNVYARYPAQKDGTPWSGHSHIDIVIWYMEADKFLSDFKRLKPRIKGKYESKTF